MKVYFADANIFLRLLLHDNKDQLDKVLKYIEECKKGLIEIVVISEIIPEMEYVLRKVYTVPRAEIASKITSIVKAKYLTIENRYLLIQAFEIYKLTNVDLVDIFLFLKSREKDGKVLTFDLDFKKLNNLYS